MSIHDPGDAFDREMEALEKDYENGDCTRSEYLRWRGELEQDYRAAAEDAARNAYEAELERW